METESFSTVAVTLTVLAALVIAANHFLAPTVDPREPPVIQQKIPYIGHVIGLLQYGLTYFELLSTKHPLPVFTLQTLGKKVYVVNSPDLISAVQKNSKVFTFNPFVSFVSPRIFDAGDDAMAIINDNLNGEKGPWGFIADGSRGMHNALAPSESLDWMTRTMLTKLAEYIEPLGESSDGVEMDLYRWSRKAFTVASTEAVYGPKNPFNHQPDLEETFWDFESGITMIVLGIAPSITARKAYKARTKFVARLNEYYASDGFKTGSDLMKRRLESNERYGAERYFGHFEIGNLLGVLVNATPTFFWMLIHIYSRPTLLADLRAEIASVTESSSSADTKTHRIVISRLKENCPLLLSTYKETLRLLTHNTTSRWVTKDTLLANQYLLKAGNIIQMPGYPVHILPSIWGANGESFNPHRFIKLEKKFRDKSQKQHPVAFRSFGGGATLCPGRHFATAELCAATAMMVMRFDIEPVTDGGGWKIPDWQRGKVTSAVPPPDGDLKVRVRKRKGLEDVEWRFGFEGSVSRFDVFDG